MSERRPILPMGLMIPSLLLVLWIIGYPLYDLLIMSVHSVDRFAQVGGFVGSANFQKLFADPLFWASFWRTCIWSTFVTLGAIALSLPVAILLSQDFPGRSIARVIVLCPWAISASMFGVVWRWALNGNGGVVNAVLMELGLTKEPIYFLATSDLAFPIAIAVGILAVVPLTVIIFLAGLASIQDDLYDAARIDGASSFSTFTNITLPLLKPFLNIAIVINIIYSFNSFAIVWVLTQGGPANSTDILVTYLYKMAFQFGRIDQAAAMSIIMFGFLLALITLYARFAMKERVT